MDNGKSAAHGCHDFCACQLYARLQIWCFPIGDVLNLFYSRKRNLRIHSDGFSVLQPERVQNRAVKRSRSYSAADNILVWRVALWMCFKGTRFCQTASPERYAEIWRHLLEPKC